MAQRPQHRPLYEVIGSWATPPPGSDLDGGQGVGPEEGPGVGEDACHEVGRRRALPGIEWLKQAQHPIVLRIPRGLAVLTGLSVVVLILLAYWAGVARGRGHERSVQAARNALNNGEQGMAAPSALGDQPRFVLGRTYLVLAELPTIPGTRHDVTPEAQRLVAFLRRNGVDARIDLVDNSVLRVIGLLGFHKKQLGGPEYEEHWRKLQQLGRQWKRLLHGITDFSAMRPEKYPFG